MDSKIAASEQINNGPLDMDGSLFLADITRIYENNPLIKGIIQLLPLGSAFDSFLSTNLNTVKREKLKVFFESLAAGDFKLTQQIIQSNEFLFCFEITYKAVLNSYRDQKIRCFAELLKNIFSDEKQNFKVIEDYEAYVSILSDLDYREFCLLIKISLLEDQFFGVSDNPLIIADTYWSNLVSYASTKFQIEEEELHSHLIRLQRTGCYELFKGSYYSDTRGKGKTTYLLKKLKEVVSLTTIE